MEARFTMLEPRKLIGYKLTMSFQDNQTYRLWNTFMPRRNEIAGRLDSNLYNIQLYREGFFEEFDPTEPFEKWAAVVVDDFEGVPPGLYPFELEGGLYAVFQYRGSGEDAPGLYRYILKEWLPEQGYVLDARPQFEIMGSKYQRGNPESEEEIWIPVRLL